MTMCIHKNVALKNESSSFGKITKLCIFYQCYLIFEGDVEHTQSKGKIGQEWKNERKDKQTDGQTDVKVEIVT